MTRNIVRLALVLGLAVAAISQPVLVHGQTSLKTNSKITYHGGPIMSGTSAVYLIWYGCWTPDCPLGADVQVPALVTDFILNLGSSPYFLINTAYADSNGARPNGALIYAGAVNDYYSRGTTLTEANLADIVADHVGPGGFLLDPNGIYVVLTSADVTVHDGDTQFCVTCCEVHGTTMKYGTSLKYAFVGNPRRCPSSCASQFSNNVTPNDNLAGDAMVSWLAHVISGVVTNPTLTSWFDRYGLENSDKCEGQFGETYLLPNGSRANIRLGMYDYLIQQNWVNGRRGRCAMSSF